MSIHVAYLSEFSAQNKTILDPKSSSWSGFDGQNTNSRHCPFKPVFLQRKRELINYLGHFDIYNKIFDRDV